jgi:hypothetical protein
MLDPIGDVKKLSSNDFFTNVDGFEDIDIIKAESYQPLNQLGLISQFEVRFEVTVNGIINDHDDYIYMLLLTVNSDENFMITYQNGSAEGMDMDNPFGASFNVESNGAGTPVLNITLNLRDLKTVIETFEWTVFNLVVDENVESYQYVDKAPDKIIKFTEPTDKSTVFETITFEGKLEESVTTITSVEYQVDSQSSSGWKPVDSSASDFSEWSFTWDSTTVQDDSVHTIYGRAYDGERYYEDSIAVYVVQDSKNNPVTIQDVPEINVGDTFQYTSTQDPSYMGIQLELITDLKETITSIETVESEGKTYDVWRRELVGGGVATYANIPIDFSLEGFSLLSQNDYAVVKSKEDVVITVTLLGTIQTTTASSYSPPLDSFQFPMAIRDKWNAASEITTTTEMSFSGNFANETTTGTMDFVYEALHTELTTVPAGDFETFVIREEQEGSEFYDINYYSAELGNFVKMETFDNNNDQLQSIELVQYSLGEGTFLEIESVEFDPELPRAEEKMDIIVYVKNTGAVNLTGGELLLTINGDDIKTIEVDLNSQEQKQVVFQWTPKSPGEHDIIISSPDDEWEEELTVDEADTKSALGQLFSGMILLILIIGIILIIVAILFVKTRKKPVQPSYQQPTGPSVFDMAEGSRGPGQESEEPRIISLNVGMSQVGGDREGEERPVKDGRPPDGAGRIKKQ